MSSEKVMKKDWRKNSMNYNDKELEIYNFCESRWKFYEFRDGGYFPSKHDNVVLNEAAERFELSVEEINDAFDKVSSEKANQTFIKMDKSEIITEIENVVKANKETPWGM